MDEETTLETLLLYLLDIDPRTAHTVSETKEYRRHGLLVRFSDDGISKKTEVFSGGKNVYQKWIFDTKPNIYEPGFWEKKLVVKAGRKWAENLDLYGG